MQNGQKYRFSLRQTDIIYKPLCTSLNLKLFVHQVTFKTVNRELHQ